MEEAAFDSYAVIKVATYKPERFMLTFVNHDAKRGQPFMRTLEPVEEPEMRSQLKDLGLTQAGIDELIQKARHNPQ